MSLPEYINRILDLGMPWNREQLSSKLVPNTNDEADVLPLALSCISKPWRTECQARLFSVFRLLTTLQQLKRSLGRFKKLALVDRQGCDLLTAFLEKKASVPSSAKYSKLTFRLVIWRLLRRK